MLAATTHIGSENSETTMEQYIFKRRTDGVHVINLRKTWEKLILAARAIAAIENPAEVSLFVCLLWLWHAGITFASKPGPGL